MLLDVILFRNIIGISTNEFDELHSNVNSELEATSITTGEAKEYAKMGRDRVMGTVMQLMVFLLYMRQAISLQFLSWLTGVSPSNLYKYNRATMNVLYNYYKDKINFGRVSDRLINGRELCNVIITTVVDGAEQAVLRPINKVIDKLIYSGIHSVYCTYNIGKKAKHTFSKMIVCAPTGYIYYVSPSYNGAMNDKSIIDLPENQFYRKLSCCEWIAADLGYKGLQNDYTNVALPFPDNNEKGYTLLDNEKHFNKQFKSIRTVVENVISHIKMWRICKNTFQVHTNDLEKAQQVHHKTWVIAAGMVNQFVMPLKGLQLEED